MARERVGSPWRSPEDGALLLRAILWGAGWLGPLLVVLGVERAAFRELLRMRVLLALRPARVASSWGTAGLALSVLMTWFTGLGTGLVAVLQPDPVPWVVVSLSALAFLLTLMLFQYVAGILVDPTDIGVVAPHPVSDRTVFAVRLTEVGAYLAVFTLAFTSGSMMLAVFGQPPLAVLFVYPLLACLCAAGTLGVVTLLFALALRVAGPAHFQRVTLWLQILGGIVLFGAFQAPRFVHREQWGLWVEQYSHLRWLWPPAQYAEWFALACGSAREAPVVVLLAAPLAPLVALFVTFRLASRSFVAGLQGTLGAPKPRATWSGGFLARLGAFATRPGAERAGFDFTAALARREPHYLRGLLPQLAMFQFMALAMGFGRQRELALFLPLSAGFLFLVLPNVLMLAQSSSTPDARGLFRVVPLASESEFLRGGVKALLVQWIGGPALALFAVQLFVAGLESLPRILLAFELTFLATLFFARRYDLALPFSRPFRVGETGAANFGLMLVSSLALGVLLGLHWLLTRHPLALTAGVLASGALLIVLWRGLDRLVCQGAPTTSRADPAD